MGFAALVGGLFPKPDVTAIVEPGFTLATGAGLPLKAPMIAASPVPPPTAAMTSAANPITLKLSDATKTATLQATQSGFSGDYTAAIQCSPTDAATVDTSKSKDGKFTVTAVKAGTCTVTITGGDSTTGTLAASIVP